MWTGPRLRSFHRGQGQGIDNGQRLGHDRSVSGKVEDAVRSAVAPGEVLATPSGRGHFRVARYTADALVLQLGETQAWTPLPWRALGYPISCVDGTGCASAVPTPPAPATQEAWTSI